MCINHMTRTLIGAGEWEHGLLFFRGVPKVKINVVDGMASIDIWLKRLAHPLEKVLRHLSCVSPSSTSSCNKDGCDVCSRANNLEIVFLREIVELV